MRSEKVVYREALQKELEREQGEKQAREGQAQEEDFADLIPGVHRSGIDRYEPKNKSTEEEEKLQRVA